jgi:alanyl-tRNA synthetase
MTERLYYRDSFLTEFDAQVVSCSGEGVVLDRTAFYPASGGQLSDIGVLEAGATQARVSEVAENEAGEVLHITDAPLAAGTRVHGRIDVRRRRDHMQQHSGQHVLSAAFVRLFGAATVSFHMGGESCTIDLDTKSVSPEQVERAEALANEVVWEDRPIEVRFASLHEARAMGVRKLPEVNHGELRLIEIRDFDLTACGGTHLRSTGQIGAILLRKTEKVRQGMRLEFVCGGRAVATARRDFATLTEVGATLSTHIWELPQQVRKSLEEVKTATRQQHKLLEQIAEFHAAQMLGERLAVSGVRVIAASFADRDLNFIKLLAQKLAKAEKVVALLGAGSGQPSLVFAQNAGGPFDMGALMKEALSIVGGRGGGARDLAQGGAPDASRFEEVLAQLAARLRKG